MIDAQALSERAAIFRGAVGSEMEAVGLGGGSLASCDASVNADEDSVFRPSPFRTLHVREAGPRFPGTNVPVIELFYHLYHNGTVREFVRRNPGVTLQMVREALYVGGQFVRYQGLSPLQHKVSSPLRSDDLPLQYWDVLAQWVLKEAANLAGSVLNTRVARYASYFRAFQRYRNEEPWNVPISHRRTIVRFKLELRTLAAILLTLSKKPRFSPLVAKAFAGRDSPMFESNSAVRDLTFELYVAAVLTAGGLSVEYREPDLVVHLQAFDVPIAVKRIKRYEKAERRILEAEAQIKRTGVPGVVAIDFSQAVSMSDYRFEAADPRDVTLPIKIELDRFFRDTYEMATKFDPNIVTSIEAFVSAPIYVRVLHNFTFAFCHRTIKEDRTAPAALERAWQISDAIFKGALHLTKKIDEVVGVIHGVDESNYWYGPLGT